MEKQATALQRLRAWLCVATSGTLTAVTPATPDIETVPGGTQAHVTILKICLLAAVSAGSLYTSALQEGMLQGRLGR